jgi:uncharacterized membrane protein
MEHGHGNEFYWQNGVRHAHEGWWGGPLHVFLLLLLLALLVAVVVWLVRRLAPSTPQAIAATPAPAVTALAGDPAVATLRMRYARGDVSREDFQHALADLTGAETDATTWPGDTPGADATPLA